MRRKRYSLSTFSRSGRKRKPSRSGAAAVEFALVAPALLTVVFVCLEFTKINMIWNLSQDAAYFAARSAMVPGATVDEAKSEAELVLSFMGTQNATIVINGNDTLDTDSDEIEVTVTVPIDDNAFLVPAFFGGRDIVATASMRTERYNGYYDPTTD